MVHKNEQLMNEMIKSYFSSEDFGVKVTKTLVSPEEERAKNTIEKTIKKGERYIETDDVVFPESN